MPARGFSLVEILVAISIIALIGAVAIPGLRQFSDDQQLTTTTSQVVNVLKTAQSSASSRVQCPRSETADYWFVRFTSSHYTLMAQCKTAGPQEVAIYTYAPNNKASESLFSAAVDTGGWCGNLPVDVVFYKNTTNYICFPPTGNPRTGTVNITIGNGSSSSVVRVEEGGVIKVE